MSECLLKIQDLQIDYKTDLETVHAVNGVSFSLNKGETLGLVGETGAGKTTTALSILGLLPERTAKVNNGTIEFDGQDVLKMTEKELQAIRGEKISMIFQDPMTALNPVMTVGDQIAESIHYHEGLSGKECMDRAIEMLELVGIPGVRGVE